MAIRMDMWRPHPRATRENMDGWETNVCIDRFHLAKYFADPVNHGRKAMHEDLHRND